MNTPPKLRQFAKQNRKNMPKAEVLLWQKLRNRQMATYRFRRQHPIPPYIVDFLCWQKKVIIELDGATHDGDRDAARDAHFAALGYLTVRFSNDDVLQNVDAVVDSIDRILAERE